MAQQVDPTVGLAKGGAAEKKKNGANKFWRGGAREKIITWAMLRSVALSPWRRRRRIYIYYDVQQEVAVAMTPVTIMSLLPTSRGYQRLLLDRKIQDTKKSEHMDRSRSRV